VIRNETAPMTTSAAGPSGYTVNEWKNAGADNTTPVHPTHADLASPVS
jgi:hypothetical protein